MGVGGVEMRAPLAPDTAIVRDALSADLGRSAVVSSGARIAAVKVFSATKKKDRDSLGEQVTSWLRAHPMLEVIETVVTQSSDAAFHCLSITLFATERSNA